MQLPECFILIRLKKRIPVLRISGFIQVIAAFGLSFAGESQLIATCRCCAGLFMFLPMPALVTYAQERPNTNSQKISVTFSLFWSISYLVATIIPTIFAKSSITIVVTIIVRSSSSAPSKVLFYLVHFSCVSTNNNLTHIPRYILQTASFHNHTYEK